MYTVTKHIIGSYSARRFCSDEATKLKKSIILPSTKFKNRLNAEQTLQRDNHIYKVNYTYIILQFMHLSIIL